MSINQQQTKDYVCFLLGKCQRDGDNGWLECSQFLTFSCARPRHAYGSALQMLCQLITRDSVTVGMWQVLICMFGRSTQILSSQTATTSADQEHNLLNCTILRVSTETWLMLAIWSFPSYTTVECYFMAKPQNTSVHAMQFVLLLYSCFIWNRICL